MVSDPRRAGLSEILRPPCLESQPGEDGGYHLPLNCQGGDNYILWSLRRKKNGGRANFLKNFEGG